MSQGETTLQTGPGSQTNNLTRWGDYSQMSVDPADDCTFWYVNEYLPANGSFNWHTRIGSFKFAGCSSQTAISSSPSSVGPGQTVTASWSGVSNPTGTDWIGVYVPGAANTSYLSWVYDDSCTHASSGTAVSSGTCTITMPTTPGTYELRLFLNGDSGYNLLATSNTVSVG